MIYIGFIANKESGKTTTFNIIKENFPDAKEIMLAEHLKEACAKAFKMDLYKMESQEEKKKTLEKSLKFTRDQIIEICDFFELKISDDAISKHIGHQFNSTREILQYVGTDLLRSIDDDIHLKWATKRAPPSSIYVVTDIRFPNEFNFFKKNKNFLSCYINREKSAIIDKSAAHASETNIKNLKPMCDVEIDNNSTIENLRGEVAAKVIPCIKKY